MLPCCQVSIQNVSCADEFFVVITYSFLSEIWWVSQHFLFINEQQTDLNMLVVKFILLDMCLRLSDVAKSVMVRNSVFELYHNRTYIMFCGIYYFIMY